jgi:hypothetical protein
MSFSADIFNIACRRTIDAFDRIDGNVAADLRALLLGLLLSLNRSAGLGGRV